MGLSGSMIERTRLIVGGICIAIISGRIVFAGDRHFAPVAAEQALCGGLSIAAEEIGYFLHLRIRAGADAAAGRVGRAVGLGARVVVVVADGAAENPAGGEAAAVAPRGGAGVGVAGAPAAAEGGKEGKGDDDEDGDASCDAAGDGGGLLGRGRAGIKSVSWLVFEKSGKY